MKYPIEEYEGIGIYEDDEDIINHTEKVVKVRKKHKCALCEKEIQKGDYALRETGFLDNEPVSAYTCIECCDKWLDEINGETD